MAGQFVEQNVTYILEMEGRLLVIENVPARVSQETAWAQRKPARVVETPMYDVG